MMICSAPSRFAAITPQRPTAPSPTTATDLPGPTFAACAAWCPVAITSESVSSDGISASSSPTGRTTSVPSACGTRTASPWPPSTPSVPYLPPCRHETCSPCRQNTHVPSDQTNGVTTRSPALTVWTWAPTSSATPMNSWPIRRPPSAGSMFRYGQRSLPQIAAWVTRTSASVGSTTCGSGTSSTRTSPARYINVARMSAFYRRRRSVLLVADMVAPGRGGAVVPDLEHREVGHEPVRRSAVPVLLARLEEDAVAGTDHLDRSAAALTEADAFGDVDRLPVRVRVPGGPRARREVDAARAQPRVARGAC